MKLLLVYLPFCNPGTFPYSISYLKSFVKDNSNYEVKCLDLNAKFHTMMFGEQYSKLEALKGDPNFNNIPNSAENLKLAELLVEFDKLSRVVYSQNNKLVIENKKPELLEEILNLILQEKPDVVGFSLVYNSQCFYIHPLLEELQSRGIICVAGGPAVTEKIKNILPCLNNEIELVEFLEHNAQSKQGAQGLILNKEKPALESHHKDYNCNTIPDFSDYDSKDYLATEIVIPLKSSNGCYYKNCAFCTHHSNKNYYEVPLDQIKQTIINSGKKHFFFIDDMISKKRLVQVAEITKSLNVKWWCQLKPTRELFGMMKLLYDSGLRAVGWGIESGSQKIINKMNKATIVTDIEIVLKESADAGIKNTAFIMFGFPGETKEDFLKTIDFLKKNSSSFQLVTTSIFGLQRGSKVFQDPEKYGITKIIEKTRTKLDNQIFFELSEGLTTEEATILRKKYTKSIKNIDKLPRIYNYFREQVILLD